MATYTPNYGLHQWVPEDKFLRTDFNEDFSKLDIELGRVDGMATELYRAVPNLAYNVYDLALKDYYESKYHGYRRALLMQDFRYQDTIESLTGGLVIQDNALVLNGAGQTGTMTTYNLGMTGVSWTRVIAWLRYKAGGTYSMAVNGQSLTMKGGWSSQTVEGTSCREMQLEGDITGENSAVISLTLSTGTSQSAVAYDFGVMFF